LNHEWESPEYCNVGIRHSRNDGIAENPHIADNDPDNQSEDCRWNNQLDTDDHSSPQCRYNFMLNEKQFFHVSGIPIQFEDFGAEFSRPFTFCVRKYFVGRSRFEDTPIL
jgi:hypothetical protein